MRRVKKDRPKIQLRKESLVQLEDEHLRLLVAGNVSCTAQLVDPHSSCLSGG